MAAPVLVLRPSRSLYCNSAGDGIVLAVGVGVLAETDLWVQGHGLRHAVHWVAGLHGVGSSYVHERDEPVFGFRFFDHDDGNWCAFRD